MKNREHYVLQAEIALSHHDAAAAAVYVDLAQMAEPAETVAEHGVDGSTVTVTIDGEPVVAASAVAAKLDALIDKELEALGEPRVPPMPDYLRSTAGPWPGPVMGGTPEKPDQQRCMRCGGWYRYPLGSYHPASECSPPPTPPAVTGVALGGGTVVSADDLRSRVRVGAVSRAIWGEQEPGWGALNSLADHGVGDYRETRDYAVASAQRVVAMIRGVA